jgi:hypothetical protein
MTWKGDFRSTMRDFNQSTKYYAPFVLNAYVALNSKTKAIELEKYFKTGSGKAVLKKRILSGLA